jgi:hypothetical protein
VSGENCGITFIIYALYQILLGLSNQDERDMQQAWKGGDERNEKIKE